MTRQILFLNGSLRRDSLNRRLGAIAARSLPATYEAVFGELTEIPHYDGDIDNRDAVPEAVQYLRHCISEAEGVYWSTPEYNYAVPGVVKNAIDWASRPLVPRSSLVGRPMAAAVATMSATNGVRALSDLKRFWSNAGGVTVPLPDVVIQNAAQRFRVASDGTETLDEAGLAMIELSVRCLIRVIESGVSEAVQENWTDYLSVLTA
jgi:chromate reductase